MAVRMLPPIRTAPRGIALAPARNTRPTPLDGNVPAPDAGIAMLPGQAVPAIAALAWAWPPNRPDSTDIAAPMSAGMPLNTEGGS